MKISDLNSLHSAVNRLFMKLFRTSDINTVKSCQSYSSFNQPSVLLKNRAEKFELKYKKSCKLVMPNG